MEASKLIQYIITEKQLYFYKDTVIKQRKVLATHRQLELKKNLSWAMVCPPMKFFLC